MTRDISPSDASGELLQRGLVDVSILKGLFARYGIKGASFCCDVCGQHHYLEWELIAGSLQEVVDRGHLRAHEPAFDPDPEHYISWDYACGLLDGFATSGDSEQSQVAVQVILNDQPAASKK